ncbi:MAG TPA: hypothetical protein VNA17_06945 [Pyrinomonadaceae bacterium]|nr:hypothetical protein [Pyrinomonadaceae bacterium]
MAKITEAVGMYAIEQNRDTGQCDLSYIPNTNKNKKNQPPTGEGKKQSPTPGREVELDKRSEVLQATRNHPELNMGTNEDREPAELSGETQNPNRAKAGR